MAYKHVGRTVRNKRKVVVAYRTIPGDANSCVVVTTENLMGDEHDSLMKLVESNAGQTANEFAEAMTRSYLPDGRNMLAAFHTTGKMVKLPTADVEMTPDTQTVINLAELNKIIAEQKGIGIEDLAISDGGSTQQTSTEIPAEIQAADDGVLTDEQLAAQYRSQADALFKEAKALREQAEELVPTKKKTAKVKAEESA